ncbi:hypothetical protein V1511DRAFT_498646 [Dipodascopsis uninucleata]
MQTTFYLQQMPLDDIDRTAEILSNDSIRINTNIKSRFRVSDFRALQRYSVHSPLRVIAHIDLDAFYAQCESVRLGLDPDIPLACQQWQGLIAINYAARKFGISRHENIADAKKKCPDLVLAHVATWKEGEESWAYRPDPDIATHKVSLDPYRQQSRLIFNILNSACEKVEKAGLDEAFLDLSKLVYEDILSDFPQINTIMQQAKEQQNDDALVPLPGLESNELSFEGFVVAVDPESENSAHRSDQVDWDDMAMMYASKIAKKIRDRVLQELYYTCSAGISCNKMLAKLCSAYKKPNNQTVLRRDAISSFLSTVKFSKIRGLGGKLGDDIASIFEVPEEGSIPFLLKFSLSELKAAVGDESASWLYRVIRGKDNSELSPKEEIKSMLSAKNFRPSVTTIKQVEKWLKIFVADIMGRILDMGPTDKSGGSKIPKTLTVGVRCSKSRSKRAIVPACLIAKLPEVLYNTAINLFNTMEKDSPILPCYHMSMSVTDFDSNEGSGGIDKFLVRPRVRVSSGENNFINQNLTDSDQNAKRNLEQDENTAGLTTSTTYICEVCQRDIEIAKHDEHSDWHFAKSLARQLHEEDPSASHLVGESETSQSFPLSSPPQKRKHIGTTSRNSRVSKEQKLEKGQRKLF